jgi:alpha-ribazole phosphatase
MAIFTCRHAPAAVEGVCYGRSNVPLKMAPGPAADLVVERLGAVEPRAIWSSPLARARDLAEQIAHRLGVPMHADARLSEIDFGLWEGLPYSEIERRDRARFLRWQADWEFLPAPGGESLHQLQDRVEAWYKGRQSELDGADVLVVSHAGPIRALRAHVLGTLFEEELRTDVPYLVPEGLDAGRVARGSVRRISTKPFV